MDDLFESVFVSCEHGRTKRSGALYTLVLHALGVEAGGVEGYRLAGKERLAAPAALRILAEARCDTPAHDPDRIAHDAAALVAALSADTDQEVVGVGVACAGFVNRTGSHVLFAPNLAWRDEPLKQRLEEQKERVPCGVEQ